MRLADFNPHFREGDGFPGSLGRLDFMCPRCRLGVVCVDLRDGPASNGVHSASPWPINFDTLSVSPSIADEGKCRRCPGWHGHIINGEIQ